MLDISALQKDTLHNVMLQQMYSLNHMWLMLELYIAEKAPQDYGTDEYYRLYEDYGSHEARRLVRSLGLPVGTIEDLADYLRHSHWAIFETIEITELSATSLRMRTRDCTAQKAARKWGLDHYDCGIGGLRIRTGFFGALNAGSTVQRVYAPGGQRPESVPPEVSCEWLVSLE